MGLEKHIFKICGKFIVYQVVDIEDSQVFKLGYDTICKVYFLPEPSFSLTYYTINKSIIYILLQYKIWQEFNIYKS